MNAATKTDWNPDLDIDGIAHVALLAASVFIVVLAVLSATADASPCARQANVSDRAAA
jgi:hypothetical protein